MNPQISTEQIEDEVIATVKQIIGPRCHKLVTGGAPTSPHVLAFLKRFFSVGSFAITWHRLVPGGVTETYGTTGRTVLPVSYSLLVPLEVGGIYRNGFVRSGVGTFASVD